MRKEQKNKKRYIRRGKQEKKIIKRYERKIKWKKLSHMVAPVHKKRCRLSGDLTLYLTHSMPLSGDLTLLYLTHSMPPSEDQTLYLTHSMPPSGDQTLY
jgi:hypothetical protein